jgi:hypothetical protein
MMCSGSFVRVAVYLLAFGSLDGVFVWSGLPSVMGVIMGILVRNLPP